MSDQWYIAKDGKRNGPLSSDQIRNMIESGSVNSEDLVWKNSFPKWIKIKQVPEFSGFFGDQDGPPDLDGGISVAKVIGTTTKTAKQVSQKLWFLDLKFEQFATPRLIGVVFLLWMLLCAVACAGTLVYAVITMPIWLAAIVMTGNILASLLSAICIRVILETFLVMFRMVEHLENLKYLKENLEK